MWSCAYITLTRFNCQLAPQATEPTYLNSFLGPLVTVNTKKLSKNQLRRVKSIYHILSCVPPPVTAAVPAPAPARRAKLAKLARRVTVLY